MRIDGRGPRTSGPGSDVRAEVDGRRCGEMARRLLRYAVKVEKNLPYDADETAPADPKTMLSDRAAGRGAVDWRLELVSSTRRGETSPSSWPRPGTVDRYCWPLRTSGGCPARPATG